MNNIPIPDDYGLYDAFCEICGNEAGSCICPECPVCGVTGDPRCYQEHGLKRTQEQISNSERILKEAYQDGIKSEDAQFDLEKFAKWYSVSNDDQFNGCAMSNW